MKIQVLYIRDIVSNCAPFAPMFVHHIGSAIRDFGDECKKPDTKLGQHPTDYELYHAGTWDDVECRFELLEKPIQLAVGANYAS